MWSRIGAHGRRMSQAIKMYSRLSHIDFNRPIEVMANGQSGLATSDSRNPINGTAVPPDGIRLPATSTPGSIKTMNQPNGMDQSGLLQLQEIWVVLTLTQIRIGSYAPSEQNRPHTDPEDDTNADPSLPVGSTSKTYNTRMDGRFWKRADSGREWTQSSSSSAHWRPRMRHEEYYSSGQLWTSASSPQVC